MAKKMSKSLKYSVICFSVIAALIVVAIIRLNNAETNSGSSSNREETKSNISSSAAGIDTLPGESDRKAYNDLQSQENERKAKEALAQGKSSLPVLVNNNKDDLNDPFNDLNLNMTPPKIKEETPVIDTTPPEVPAPVVQPAPVVVQPPVSQMQPAPMQAPAYNSGERREARQKTDAQVKAYLALFAPSVATQERDYTGADIKEEKINATNGTGQGGTSANVNGKAALVRAGTIIPAVMITALNSDTPGPVMAQIVSGEFKGARLLGQMRSSDKGIVVQFNQLSIAGHNKTYSINAFAIDPNSTSTSLASDVDNHYFLRYGLGLAAAFISGYGEAVQNKGTTTTVGPMGNVTQTQGDLSHSEIAESAFGKMGQKLGQELDKDTNRKPTVTVDSGVPLGILFMNDF